MFLAQIVSRLSSNRGFLGSQTTRQLCSRWRSTCSDTTDARAVIVRRLANELEGTTVFQLNRPEVRNAINFQMLNELLEAIGDVKKTDDVTAVILRSGHPGSFCAGADLKERLTLPVNLYKRWSLTIRAVFWQLTTLPVPVLAAIDGVALGGGAELTLATDIRVAASNVDKIGFPETSLAIIPGAGGTQSLPRLIGPALAKELLFTSRRFNAREALRLGLVNHVVEQNQDGDAAYRKCLGLAQCFSKDRPVTERVKTDLTFNTR